VRRAAAAACTWWLVGCGGGTALVDSRESAPEPALDPGGTEADLVRDLRATVLEGYAQLSLGNLEAYGDRVADEGTVAFVRIGPDDGYIGSKRTHGTEVYRIEPCVEILSRSLEIHLSLDRSFAWIFDDVSCRVKDPFEGRKVAIPLRLTAVFQRHLDGWVLLMQHVSYALPVDEIRAWARAGTLRRPARVDRPIAADDGVRRMIKNAVWGLVENQPGYRARKRASDAGALVLWPGPDHEFRGRTLAEAPELEDLFGPGSELALGGVAIGVARNQKHAWVVANLDVLTPGNDAPLTIGLRATYVFERRDDTPGLWTQVQAHVSVPVVQASLTRRAFGLELPDLSNLPRFGPPPAAAEPSASPPGR
jgi:ketosteroid isomerase-like protein